MAILRYSICVLPFVTIELIIDEYFACNPLLYFSQYLYRGNTLTVEGLMISDLFLLFLFFSNSTFDLLLLSSHQKTNIERVLCKISLHSLPTGLISTEPVCMRGKYCFTCLWCRQSGASRKLVLYFPLSLAVTNLKQAADHTYVLTKDLCIKKIIQPSFNSPNQHSFTRGSSTVTIYVDLFIVLVLQWCRFHHSVYMIQSCNDGSKWFNHFKNGWTKSPASHLKAAGLGSRPPRTAPRDKAVDDTWINKHH